MMKIIDTRGELCPKPIIISKKAMLELDINENFQILTDNETSLSNLQRFLKDNNVICEVEKKADHYCIHAKKYQKTELNLIEENYCSLPSKTADYVICFKSDKMGIGDDALGTILIKAFINTLPELDKKPQSLIFYNSSVLLCQNDSPVYDSLKSLENEGISLIICGTCADFYKIKDKINIGQISNMLAICEKLVKAEKIVYP